MNIRGKVAVVVGASGAIGGAIAEEFAREGAAVVLGSRSGKVDGLIERIASKGARHTQAAIDVTDVSQVEWVLKKLDSEFGPISILVNAAGVYGPIGPVEANDPVAWMNAVNSNIVGAFNLVHAAIPLMLKNGGGRIIHFSGGGGAYGRPFFSSYSTCKAAIVRFTESIALELKDRNIYVNVIAPGPVKSALWEELRAAGTTAGADAENELRKMDSEGGVPAQRAARLAVFLGGTELPVTGRLISAVWDDWEHLDNHVNTLLESDVWTLRRVSMETK